MNLGSKAVHCIYRFITFLKMVNRFLGHKNSVKCVSDVMMRAILYNLEIPLSISN